VSSVPLTFNNGYTTTASDIAVIKEGGRTIQERGGVAGSINRTLRNEQAETNYVVSTLVKDGVDENNRPLYKRNIYSFNSASEAKNFKTKVNDVGLAKQAINSASGNIIATGSTKDGEKSFEFTDNATDWQKNTENQIKNVSKKQLSNVGREEGGEVKNHTTEFTNKKVSNTKDDSIDAAAELKKEAEKRAGLGRKKYDNLFYPSFIRKSNQDKLVIKILKKKIQTSNEASSNRRDRFQAFKTNEGRRLSYDIPKGNQFYKDRGKIVGFGRAEAFEDAQDRIYGQNKENKNKLEFDKETIGSITLPIPNGVSDQNTVSFGQGTLNPVQRAISDVALKTILSGTKEGGKTAADIFKKVSKNKPELKKALAGFIAGTASGIDPNELLARTEGTIFNNNLALLFKSPTLRPFTFQFTLSPRDRGEAVQVQKIIRAFKQSSAVQRSVSEIFLAAPNTYGLQFFKGPTPHNFLPQIKECALLNVGVNYMPENSYMTYEDSSMVSYSLSLSFQELTPIFNSDYNDFDQNTDVSIGF